MAPGASRSGGRCGAKITRQRGFLGANVGPLRTNQPAPLPAGPGPGQVHASIVKFIERNWGLPPLTSRSRDNLPNPTMSLTNPYVPTNSPAIGDLFDMFHF